MYTTFIRLVTHGCSLEYLYNEMSTTATTTTTVKSATVTAIENATTSAAKLALATVTETKTRTFYYPFKNMKSMETLTKTTAATLNMEESYTSSSSSKGTTTNAKHFLPQLLKSNESQQQLHLHEHQHELQLAPTARTNTPLLLLHTPTSKLTRRPLSSSPSTTSSAKASHRQCTPTTNMVKPPLFEVKLELVGMQIRYQPTFESNVENNFQQIVEQLLLDISRACNCMPRIFRDNSTTLSSDDEWCDIYAEQTTETKLIHDYSNVKQQLQQQLQPNKGRELEDFVESQVDSKRDTTTAMTNKKFTTATAKGIISLSNS